MFLQFLSPCLEHSNRLVRESAVRVTLDLYRKVCNSYLLFCTFVFLLNSLLLPSLPLSLPFHSPPLPYHTPSFPPSFPHSQSPYLLVFHLTSAPCSMHSMGCRFVAGCLYKSKVLNEGKGFGRPCSIALNR